MFWNWIWIVASLGLLYFGAEGLVRGSASLALRLGLTPLVVGLTVVAMGTSMPEVMVSVKAAMQGRGYLAVGNVIGSNIFNILAILGAGSLVVPLVAPDIRALDIWSMVGISALLLPVLWTGLRVTRGEGAMLLGCYGVYLFFLWPK